MLSFIIVIWFTASVSLPSSVKLENEGDIFLKLKEMNEMNLGHIFQGKVEEFTYWERK